MLNYLNKLLLLISISSIILNINVTQLQAKPKKLPIPRFVTIKFNKVNARTGAGKDCPIDWVFIKKDEPVQVIAEFEQWRKIRDIDNQGGWVHASTISGKRAVVIISKKIIPLYSRPNLQNEKNTDKKADYVAKLEPLLRCTLNKSVDQWHKITCKSFSGWVESKYLWGI